MTYLTINDEISILIDNWMEMLAYQDRMTFEDMVDDLLEDGYPLVEINGIIVVEL
jgi:hypothetical protein